MLDIHLTSDHATYCYLVLQRYGNNNRMIG
jgi:hypothetical protein